MRKTTRNLRRLNISIRDGAYFAWSEWTAVLHTPISFFFDIECIALPLAILFTGVKKSNATGEGSQHLS